MSAASTRAILGLATLSFAFCTSVAHGEEQALKPSPRIDRTQERRLDSDLDDMTVGSDIEEADALSYEEVAKETEKEENRVKGDIRKMETQMQSVQMDKERARKNAELTQQKLELQQKKNVETRRRLLLTRKAKEEAERASAQEQEKLAALEAEGRNLEEDNRDSEAAIRTAAATRTQLIERQQAANAKIKHEKDRQPALASQRSRLIQQNQILQANLKKSEKLKADRAP